MKTFWYQFFDMHSGGSRKTPYDSIYIEATSEDRARDIFYNIYHRKPHYVTCDCCGPDYTVSEYELFDELLDNLTNDFSFAVHRCFY